MGTSHGRSGRPEGLLDATDLQHEGPLGSQLAGAVQGDRVDQPAVEEVLPVDLDRRVHAGQCSGGQDGGHEGPAVNQCSAARSMLAATQANSTGSSSISVDRQVPGQQAAQRAGARCGAGARGWRWPPPAGAATCRAAVGDRVDPQRLHAAHPGGLGSAASSAPFMAPIEVPRIRSGVIPCSSRAASMPTSAAPSTPPPPRTKAVRAPVMLALSHPARSRPRCSAEPADASASRLRPCEAPACTRLRQVKSPSDKPWLAGRQPSDRGGVPQVRTWLLLPRGRSAASAGLAAARPGPRRGSGVRVGSPDQRHTRQGPRGADHEETSR